MAPAATSRAGPGSAGASRAARPALRLSLEHRLPLLMAGVLVATSALFLGVTYAVLTREAEAATHERLTNASLEVAATAAAALEARVAEMAGVAQARLLRASLLAAGPGGALPPPEELLELLALPEGPPATVELRRRDGTLVARVGPEPGLGAGWPRDLPDGSAATTVMEVDGDGVYAWTIVPVTASEDTIGWIGRRLRIGGAAGAEGTLAQLTGEAVTLYMRNADGSAWSRHPGVPMEPPTSSGLRRSGALLYHWPGAGAAIAGESEVPGTPLVVVMQTPLRLVHGRARATVSSLALASLLLVLLGVGAAWAVGRRVAGPIVAVTRAAEAMTDGDYTRRVQPAGVDELGRLADTFNQMAEEVEAARRELMERIDQAQGARVEAEDLRASAERARKAAEEANRAKDDFLAVMSHELRTPLNAIAGYVQLMEMGIRGPLSEGQAEALRRISRNQAHLLTLIDGLLTHAQLHAGKVDYVVSRVPVKDAFAELELFFAPQLDEGGLTFAWRVAEPELSVTADPDKLYQILLNLLSNATKFTPPGGSVSVEATAAGGSVSIAVRDTGVGIPAELLEAVFDPFFQGHREPGRPTAGVGLGLAISRELARAMEGDLRVSSAPGEGSVFTLVLPGGKAPEAVEEKSTERQHTGLPGD